MKKTCLSLSFLIIFILSATAYAFYPANLYLWKKNPYDYGPCGFCTNYLNFVENQNRTNFSDYKLLTQAGYYYFRLTGHEGATVTLFGQPEYKTHEGYLIVAKKDSRDISVNDLEAFAPGEWVDVPATEGEGAYSAYYHPGEDFKDNVGSVKWGNWWGEGSHPK